MLLDKLAFTENKYEELSVKISDPSIMANQKNGESYVRSTLI